MNLKLPLITALSFLALTAFAQSSTHLSEQQALNLGTEAYIYGYPLITMDLTRQVMTNYAKPTPYRGAPLGQFMNARAYPDPAFKEVTSPNADTLYSTAWLDVSKEPYVFHVPDEAERYYLMQLLDGWTEVFADPGTRTTGTKARDFVIVGPDWEGDLPDGLTVLDSPTNMVWIIGRTYSTGTPDDYQKVHNLQDQYQLMPLSAYGHGAYTPPVGGVNPAIDMKTAVRTQVNQMDAATYFNRLAQLLKTNPPTEEDAEMVEKLKKIGVVAGQPFDMTKHDSDEAIGLTAAVAAGQEKIMAHFYDAGVKANNWMINKNTGAYGADYLQRAFVAEMGLGANLPEDAVYAAAKLDKAGLPLNGTYKYVMHFAKGDLPPVKGFWSITMYDNQYFFVPNSIRRYSINQRQALHFNADGSLDIYIQHDSPGQDKETNWLPAPPEAFILMFRLYWPKESVLKGEWVPPAIEKIS